MGLHRVARVTIVGLCLLVLAGCGGGLSSANNGLFGGPALTPAQAEARTLARAQQDALNASAGTAVSGTRRTSRLSDLFNGGDDPNTRIEVNKYIWTAALDVLNFLPIESVDPFTGVIVTGYGTPPGSNRAYRATVYVQDPALDARSLKVSLQSSGGGAVDPATVRAVEDAILSRARQLRIADSKL